MNYINFSKSYHVQMLTKRDIPLILALCEKNTQFYEHCPPFVTEGSIRDDMCALPQRKMDEPQDKYYLGFFDDAEQLVAVMDFIDHYPTERSCFIGFFMMERLSRGGLKNAQNWKRGLFHSPMFRITCIIRKGNN